MKTIEEMIIYHTSKGMTIYQAENYICQEIILNKISNSPMSNNVLIKGGVLMFNLTHNLRRTTTDLDFDFIRYDISDYSIKLFVDLLNKYDSQYKVTCNKIDTLHQEDYQGKRVWIIIYDKSKRIRFKMDIGIHTLLAIEQKECCFYFDDDEEVTLKVNPPEQMVAEKIYSLAMHGAFSTRFKDVFDIYYLVNKNMVDKKICKMCLELLAIKQAHGIKTIEDICEKVSLAFEDKQYIDNIKTSRDKWIDVDYKVAFDAILDFLYSIN